MNRPSRSRPGVLWPLAIALVLATQPASGQNRDSGVLELRAGGAEVGQEEFTLNPAGNGLTLTGKSLFTAQRPPLEFNLSLDRASPSEFAFQFRRTAGPAAQFFAVMGRGRLTVRRIEAGRERAGESPGSPDLIPLADSMITPLLQVIPFLSDTAVTLTGVYPQGNRRAPFVARRSIGEDGSVLIQLSGEVEAELRLGPDGHLRRATLPRLGLVAERRPP